MQNLEEKVDIIIQGQDEIRSSIRNIRDVEINLLQSQGDILRAQYKIHEEIFNLKENQKAIQKDISGLKEKQIIMQENIYSLKENQNMIRQDIVKLENKVDNNQEQLTKRLDENLYEISAMLQEVHNKLDGKIKKKVAIF